MIKDLGNGRILVDNGPVQMMVYAEKNGAPMRKEAELSLIHISIQGNNLSYYTLWVHQIKTPIAAIDLLLQEESSEDGAEGARPAPAEAQDYAARRQRMSLIRQELFQIQRYACLLYTSRCV